MNPPSPRARPSHTKSVCLSSVIPSVIATTTNSKRYNHNRRSASPQAIFRNKRDTNKRRKLTNYLLLDVPPHSKPTDLPHHGLYISGIPHPSSQLPSTAAAFNLFPRRRKTKVKAHQISRASSQNLQVEHDPERLHSNAFSHLRKDLARNQEAFVHKMRSHEESYSNSIPKSLSRESYGPVFDDPQQEDVDIILPTSDPHLSSFVYHTRHPKTLDDAAEEDWAMLDIESSSVSHTDSDGVDTFSSPCISPHPSSPALHKDSGSVTTEQSENESPSPSASVTTCDAPLLTPQISRDSGIHHDSDPYRHHNEYNTSVSSHYHHTHGPSVNSEEELAALSLALANGACELNDYGHARLYASNLPLAGTSMDDEGFTGELWH